ncbi:PAS domain-containing sensor histidine kinase [Brevibacillus daliensis]|uniref:PAS domain-containing sensor histidine kinase n=1 Tax=Brevibacillus daliensis TaxID=2892995 RepID=UPI001E3F26A6|nr:PAS domain-containing sensor histidine kinase [Brevibacillus daliensis]
MNRMFMQDEYFSAFLHALPEAFLVLSEQREVLYVNQAWTKMTGYTQEELARVFPMYIPEEKLHLYKLKQEKQHLPIEISVMHKNGHPIILLFRPFLLPWEDIGFVVKDITKERRIEQKLYEVKQQLHSFVQHSNDSITLFAKDYSIINVSKSFESITGFRPEELISDPNLVIPEGYVDQRKIHFKTVLETGETTMFRTKRRHKAGHSFDASITYSPIRNKAGEIIGVASAMRNIAEKVRIETQLWEAKELLESFVKSTTDAIVMLDLNGKIMSYNPAFKKIYGYTAFEVDQNINQMFEPAYVDDLSDKIHRTIRGESFHDIQVSCTRSDGQQIDVLCTCIPIRNNLGTIIAIAIITKDVTEQKKTAEALKDSEAKYRLITENMTDLIAILDRRGTYTYVSPSFFTILGYKPESIIGLHYKDLVHTEDLPRLYTRRRKMITHGSVMQMEIRYLCATGEWMYLEANGTPIRDEKGRVEHFVFVARNITERKQAEELLRNSDKLSMIGELAAGVAHEIRNPLTALRGFIQLLQASETKNKFYFDVMITELDRINFIVSELLVLSKPQVQHYKQTNVLHIIRDVITLLESQALLHNVMFHIEGATNELTITCEENQIKQVFINIVKNAIEAMPNGGTITIDTTQEGNHIQICFKDQGCGIPKERFDKLGEPFYTTKDKGTGLGLMVSNKIIRDHHGHFTIDSVMDEGTTVCVHLPLTFIKQ